MRLHQLKPPFELRHGRAATASAVASGGQGGRGVHVRTEREHGGSMQRRERPRELRQEEQDASARLNRSDRYRRHVSARPTAAPTAVRCLLGVCPSRH